MTICVRRMRASDVDHRIDLHMQVVSKFRYLGDAAEVSKKHLRRLESDHAIDRRMQRVRLELNRRRCGQNERTLIGVEFAIRESERVAGKKTSTLFVINRHVMPCVAGCVDTQQFSSGEIDDVVVAGRVDTRGIDRHQRAVAALDFFLAVNGRRAGDELARVDHVPSTARMNDGAGVRQFLHQRTGAAGVIEMHVRENHVIDSIDGNLLLRQRIEQ